MDTTVFETFTQAGQQQVIYLALGLVLICVFIYLLSILRELGRNHNQEGQEENQRQAGATQYRKQGEEPHTNTKAKKAEIKNLLDVDYHKNH